jgi:hypothetical protein
MWPTDSRSGLQSSGLQAGVVYIDDKLSRLARGSGCDDEDVILDLCGYLALLAAVSEADAVASDSDGVMNKKNIGSTLGSLLEEMNVLRETQRLARKKRVARTAAEP